MLNVRSVKGLLTFTVLIAIMHGCVMTIGDIIVTSDTSGRDLLKPFLEPLFNERSTAAVCF